MKIFIGIVVLMLLLKGDLIQAVLLTATYLFTYIVDQSTSQPLQVPQEPESKEQVQENMADFAQYGDSPIGKAYNPRENYIGGIYDFTGHLAFEQLPVVPP